MAQDPATQAIRPVREFVYSHVLKRTRVTQLTDSDDLFKVLDFDSLDFVELIMELEDEYVIDIPDTDEVTARLRTVGGMIQYVEENAQ